MQRNREPEHSNPADRIHSIFQELATKLDTSIWKRVSTVTQYMEELTNATSAHAHTRARDDGGARNPVVVAHAIVLRNALRRVWALGRNVHKMTVPLSEQTNMTVAGMIWINMAKLATFIYDLDAEENTARRRRLHATDLSEAKASGLIMFSESVLEYSAWQLFMAVDLLREKWSRIIIGTGIENYLDLLTIRAGFLCTNLYSEAENPQATMDHPTYCIKVGDYWMLSEAAICRLEALVWAMTQRVVLRATYKEEDASGATMEQPLSNLHNSIRLVNNSSREEVLAWEEMAGQRFSISLADLGVTWVVFTDYCRVLATSQRVKSYKIQIKDRAASLYMAVPVGAREIADKQLVQLVLLTQHYSNNMATALEYAFQNVDPLVALEESITRARVGMTNVRVDPEQEIAILMLMETIASHVFSGWISHFVVFEKDLGAWRMRRQMHPYPVIVQTCNKWHVSYAGRLWLTNEALVACYAWCYIVWFGFMGVVKLGDVCYGFDSVLQALFCGEYEERTGGAVASLDAASNVMVQE